MKAPEKLYVDTNDNFSDSILYCYVENDKEDDIEYVRKDAFIDKACKWLSKHFYDKDYEIRDDEGCWIDADLMITDFRKAMEG